MKPEEFCRWLQGFCELHGEPPTAAQWKSIKEHLQTLYTKVTPMMAPKPPRGGFGGGPGGDSIC